MPEGLRVVDLDTGELISPGCRGCHDLKTKVTGLEQDIQTVQEENMRLLRAVKALRRSADEARAKHRRRAEVEAVFFDWQQTCSKARSKLSAERFDIILARLNEGYTPEHFHLAAFGAANANPWPPKQGQEPLTEIATYAKQGTWLEQFARAGALAKRTRP